jgi:hypothetical protein
MGEEFAQGFLILGTQKADPPQAKTHPHHQDHGQELD